MTHYTTTRSTRATANLEDVSLDPPEEEEKALTRRILRPQIVDNLKDATQPVKVTIMHQRRHTLKEQWLDADSFNQATLKAGQEVRMVLNCHQSAKLYEALRDLHAIAEGGIPEGGKRLAVIDMEHATAIRNDHYRILEEVIQTEGDDFWTILDSLRPGLLQAAALKLQHQNRMEAIEAFRAFLEAPKVNEDVWQGFFETNEWIFGHGLDYRYLKQIQAQANYGGVDFDGTGAPRGDYLMARKARVGFTVIVDIKTPFTELLGKQKYRNRAYDLGSELTGAVAQVQAQCAQWGEEGARQAGNQERLLKAGIYTHEPKGILIIGNTKQVEDDMDKRTTFERFRRNLHNPQIITFDELFERAKFMVSDPSQGQ